MQRSVFNQAYDALVKAGIDPKSAILSQSYLRFEVLAALGKTNYQFGVLVNDQPGGQAIRATENRLNLQDAFFVGSVQFLIGLTPLTTDTAFPLFTSNNPATFSTAGASTALWNVYNGYMSLSVNNKIITPSWDLLRHFNTTQTQFTAAANSPVDQRDLFQDGAVPCEPNWVLQGQKNNNLSINLPQAIGTLQAANSTILAVIMRGVLAQNVTVVS